MNEQLSELDMYDPLPFEARLSIQEQEEDERFRQGPSKNELDDHDYCQRYPEAGSFREPVLCRNSICFAVAEIDGFCPFHYSDRSYA